MPAPALANLVETGSTPANNPGDWVTANDYPPLALRNGVQGTTGFQLSIDQQGAVSQCEIVQSSGSPDLDAATCAVVTQRARFNPATDADGRPVAGSFRSRVRWVLPASAPAGTRAPLPTAETTIGRTVVEADGSTSHCEYSRHGAPFTPTTCPPTLFEPFRDAAGAPVRKLLTTTFTITITDAPQ